MSTRSVILSGFMGTGKSTVGPALASALKLPFLDTDAEIERMSGSSIVELWQREGETAFRARESELVERLLADGSRRVIAFGGGTVTTDRARRMAVDRGIVVTLTAPAATVVARVSDLRARPNLALGGDPVARARDLLDQRASAYSECHLTVSTEDLGVAAVTQEILEVVRRDPLLVPLGTRSYTVDVCLDEPARLAGALMRCSASALILVTDANVLAARGGAFAKALTAYRGEVTRVVLEPGEVHKNLDAVKSIWDAALSAGVDRDAVVLAIGGGVVGDLAGFAAACLLRGVRLIQVPTTLLSMIDSSVGGKTGLDHPTGKNLIGAFFQPVAVVADIAHLSTLDRRQLAAGLAEAVKIAVATDEVFLERLEALAPALARAEPEALTEVVRRAVRAKILVVRDDEREAGIRALLNLGHTVGHALEAHAGYDRWLHGEAVALGTLAEMRATAALGWTPTALVGRIADLQRSLGLPQDIDASEVEASWPFAAADKKRAGDSLRLPVVVGPGRAEVKRVPLAELKKALLRTS
jgi:shikimate kinase / 3-dehydroquinate synthase